VNDQHVMSAMRFWQEVYLAVIRTGMNTAAAKVMADQAWLDFEKRVTDTNQQGLK